MPAINLRKITFASFFLLVSVLFAFPEENENTIYIINAVEFKVDGRSMHFVLMDRGEFVTGEKITGKGNLDAYIADKTQLLRNSRLHDEVLIEYTFGAAETGDAIPVSLNVYIKDSNNFVIMPYPRYSSNDGFKINLNLRDYNFLGTLQALRIDLSYRYYNNPHNDIINHETGISLETDIPFRAAGLNWNTRIGAWLKYDFGKRNPGSEEALYNYNVVGLSVNLPWHSSSFNVGINQFLIINEDISGDSKLYGVEGRYYDPYGGTEAYISWYIPLGIQIGQFGMLGYNPGILARINYPYSEMDGSRKLVSTFSHSLGFARIDWIDNFRKGFSLSVSNSVNVFLDREDAPVRFNISVNAIFHWPFITFMGVSARLQYWQTRHWSDMNFNKNGAGWINLGGSGGPLRGIWDDGITAEYIVAGNLDIPIRILPFRPSKWFNYNRLRYFNVDVFFTPFTDFAIFQGTSRLTDSAVSEYITFAFENMINTVGFDLTVFSIHWPNLRLRGSLGYDIQRISRDGLGLKWGFFPQWDEIYIGMDLHY